MCFKAEMPLKPQFHFQLRVAMRITCPLQHTTKARAGVRTTFFIMLVCLVQNSILK